MIHSHTSCSLHGSLYFFFKSTQSTTFCFYRQTYRQTARQTYRQTARYSLKHIILFSPSPLKKKWWIMPRDDVPELLHKLPQHFNFQTRDSLHIKSMCDRTSRRSCEEVHYILQHAGILHNVHVFYSPQRYVLHRLLLLGCPRQESLQAAQVDRAVPIVWNDGGVLVRKTTRFELEGARSVKAEAMQSMHFHLWCLQICPRTQSQK